MTEKDFVEFFWVLRTLFFTAFLFHVINVLVQEFDVVFYSKEIQGNQIQAEYNKSKKSIKVTVITKRM